MPDAPATRIEIERTITPDEYIAAMERYPGAPFVRKERVYFWANGRRWELDLFAKPSGRVYLEAEVASETEHVETPDFLQIEDEVTGIEQHTNTFLAALP